MAATCHLFIWLKLVSLAGVDPATSGQGQRLGKEPPTGVPPCVVYYICDPELYLNLNVCVVWAATGPGLSPSPWSRAISYMTHNYVIWCARARLYIWFKWLCNQNYPPLVTLLFAYGTEPHLKLRVVT
jgi:hypothetical protein